MTGSAGRLEHEHPQPLPSISVVVCTRDRPQELRACLVALGQIDYPDYEVIVVDNASETAETSAIVEAARLRYVREDRPGLDWARNRGWRLARYDIIAFTDDDVLVDPMWLRGIARALESPRVTAVTGRVLPAQLETPAQRLYELYVGEASRRLAPQRFQLEELSTRQRIETYRIGVGANMAFRRSAFAFAGEFDTALDAGTPSAGAGDLDMLHRIIECGGEIRYEPSALVRHRHRADMAALTNQLRANGRSYGVYLIKLWRRQSVGSGALLLYAMGVWLPWLLSRLLRGLLGLHPLPLRLLWAEMRGALEAPGAYLRTYRRDRWIREGKPSAPTNAASFLEDRNAGDEASRLERRT